MPQRELKLCLEDRISDITDILLKGKDVEIRTDPNTGVRIISVDKKVIKKPLTTCQRFQDTFQEPCQ